jgi:CubicO group peptidase (beta-lactamase class C family)
MNRLLTILGIVSLLTGAAAAKPPKEDTDFAAGETGRAIVAFVKRAEALGFSGAVLAARDGKVVAAAGAGHAELAGKVPVTPATLFEIASATKQFTAAAVMRLVQAGKLALDDPIGKHLPDVPANCKAITVRHLLQHTSGIPGTNSQGGGDDVRRVLPVFLRGGPRHEPGTHWEYWNQGYALLSEIVARAAGKSYVAYCEEELFRPAKLRATCFTGDAAPRGATVAVGRSARGPSRSALEHPYGSYGFQYRGMGGAVTSVWDLWRWDRALRGDDVLGAPAKAKLFEPGLRDYALGWFVKKERGRVVQSHGGGVRGFVCDVRRYPDDDGCLFVLCNRDDAPVRDVARAVEAILFGEAKGAVTPPRALDDDVAAALAGKYKDARGTELVVTRDGKVTRVRIHWSPPRGPVTRAVLGANTNGDVVLYEWTSETPLLTGGLNGTVTRITIHDRTFQRVP